MRRPRLPRPFPLRSLRSLRGRLALAFGLGALTLSVALALIAYGYTRSYLVGQQRRVATQQTYDNARLLREGLRPGNVSVTTLLTSLTSSGRVAAVVDHQGRWFASSLAVGRGLLPGALRDLVTSGTPARMTVRLHGRPQLVVGVPLPEVDAAYFEVTDLSGLARTLGTIAAGLTLAAVATTVAGLAGGLWTSRRLVRPLRRVATASSEIGAGRLDTRLPPAGDRELAAVTTAFNGMADALQERLERDARFAADVSHELRSPLTTLGNAVNLLKTRRGYLPETGQEALDLVDGELVRFRNLVQDLLEVARIDADVDTPVLADVRVGELVLRSCRHHDVPVQVDEQALGTVVAGDKRRLERVLANLLDNADRHGGGAVGVRVRRDGDVVRVEVDDAGPGVPADARERVFERFARGAASRDRSQGVGLGLAIVREHVRAHGGEVRVTDRPGGGARFVVELPVAVPEGGGDPVDAAVAP